jgi:hypothetical protein
MQTLHNGATIGGIDPLVVETPKPKAKESKKPVVETAAVSVSAESTAPILAAAKAALDAGDLAKSVSHLVTAWRVRPLAEIANVIDWLCRNQTTESNCSGSSKASQEAWAAAFKANDPHLVHLVTRFLPTVPINVGVERLEALVVREPDPRIEAGMVDWICRQPYTSTSSQKFFNRLFQRLATCQDGRQLPRLQARLKELPEKDDTTMDSWMRQRIDTLIAKVQQRLQVVAALLPDEAEQAVLAGFDGDDAARIAALQAVFADPSDAKRLAYASIAPADDPRRQLIELQQKSKPSKADTAQINNLIACHLDTFVPFHYRLQNHGYKIRLGFLSEAHPDWWLTPEHINDPHWSTVEVLLMSTKSLMMRPHLPLLRRIEELELWSEDNQDAPKLSDLIVRPGVTAVQSREPLGRLAGIERAFPNLRSLDLSIRNNTPPDAPGDLLLLQQLTALTMKGEGTQNVHYFNGAKWVALLLLARSGLLTFNAELEFRQGSLIVACQRKSSGDVWELVVTLPGIGHDPDALFVHVRHVLEACAGVVGNVRIALEAAGELALVKKALSGLPVTWES